VLRGLTNNGEEFRKYYVGFCDGMNGLIEVTEWCKGTKLL